MQKKKDLAVFEHRGIMYLFIYLLTNLRPKEISSLLFKSEWP